MMNLQDDNESKNREEHVHVLHDKIHVYENCGKSNAHM